MKTTSTSALLLIAGILVSLTASAQPDLIWEQSYNFRSGGRAQHISYSPEDGYLLVSAVIGQYDGDEGYGNKAYPYVMRLGANGNPIWIHEGAEARIADSPIATRCDWGGYLVIGATKETEEQTPWSITAKNIDIETGEVAWEWNYPTDELTSMRVASAWNIPNGRMLVFGWTHPAQYWVEPTNDNVFVMEILTDTGELLSTTYIPGTERVSLTQVQRLYDGGFLLIGKNGEPEPRMGGKAFVMRIASDYEVVWSQELEGEGEDNITGMAPWVGGFHLLCLNYDVQLEMEQTYLVNMNLDGEILWRTSLGGDWRTCGYSIDRTPEGNLWIGGRCIPAGEVGPDKAWLAAVNGDGEMLWQENLSAENYGSVYGLATTRDGGVFVSCDGPKMMYYGPFAQNVRGDRVTAPPSELIIKTATPNPFNPTTVVSFDVPKAGHVMIGLSDIAGRTLKSWVAEAAKPGELNITIDGANLTAGAYWVSVRQGENTAMSKIVLLK